MYGSQSAKGVAGSEPKLPEEHSDDQWRGLLKKQASGSDYHHFSRTELLRAKPLDSFTIFLQSSKYAKCRD